MSEDRGWHVYMVRCADGSLYTGITTDIQRRLDEHNHSDRLAARYTVSRRPVKVVYAEISATRSEATRRESALRRLTKKQKEALIKPARVDQRMG